MEHGSARRGEDSGGSSSGALPVAAVESWPVLFQTEDNAFLPDQPVGLMSQVSAGLSEKVVFHPPHRPCLWGAGSLLRAAEPELFGSPRHHQARGMERLAPGVWENQASCMPVPVGVSDEDGPGPGRPGVHGAPDKDGCFEKGLLPEGAPLVP
ncbi:hypothetical protein TREES_T100020666 [Tupaia chinensis]|uniref:Uncharacterized protein n=1 Tax=Tupaia chinensis TaxID=246437 RepID=L9KQU3_TUPCH|nr:hypothetical protein TREES_T100020666 [Tupaia chinensis]